MMDLGDLEEQRGHPAQALDWLRRGYESAQGAATRIQWGGAYLRALIRLRPDDEAMIRSVMKQWLSELQALDGIHGRNRRALEQVSAALHEWNRSGRHAALLAQLRDALDASCRAASRSENAASCAEIVARI